MPPLLTNGVSYGKIYVKEWSLAKSLEAVLYEQKKALQTWRGVVARLGYSVTPEMEELAWELLLLYGDVLAAPSVETDEDVYKAAYDLAQRSLDHFDLTTVKRLFRDQLLEAVLRQSTAQGDVANRAIRFANLLSDAYSEANSDLLRKTIRHQRAERLSDELRTAKRIQQHLLPRTMPVIPGFEFAGRLVPAAEVGGDYWSVKHYPEDGIVTMKLADISGHGIAAATLVAAVKFVSGGYYRSAPTAAKVIEYTNRVLVRETPTEVLVTMVYAWLKPQSREIVIVNAGHEPVFICKKDRCIDIPPTGPLLGVTEADYDEIVMDMDPGDVLFFGSDGLSEAGVGEPFGIPRLKELVVANREKSAQEIGDIIMSAVTEHEAAPHDDMSLLIVRCLPD